MTRNVIVMIYGKGEKVVKHSHSQIWTEFQSSFSIYYAIIHVVQLIDTENKRNSPIYLNSAVDAQTLLYNDRHVMSTKSGPVEMVQSAKALSCDNRNPNLTLQKLFLTSFATLHSLNLLNVFRIIA
jgi:hypothetical protein